MTREEWYENLKSITQDQKDQALFFAVENVEHEQVEALLKAGAKVNDGQDMFTWILRRTDDAKMCNIMLDCGMRCDNTLYKDLSFLFDEDKEQAYRILGRMLNAGMTEDERYKAAAGALKKGDYTYLDAYIVRPGEDMTRMIDHAGWGRRDVAANKDDTRDISHEDIEKYVAWRNSVSTLYQAVFANGITEEKLKESVAADGMTGLMLAARAGKMGDVDAFYKANPGAALDVPTVLKEDKYGQSVVSLLGQHMELQKIFAPHYWGARPEDALALLAGLPEMYRPQVDAVEVATQAAATRKTLRAGPSSK